MREGHCKKRGSSQCLSTCSMCAQVWGKSHGMSTHCCDCQGNHGALTCVMKRLMGARFTHTSLF